MRTWAVAGAAILLMAAVSTTVGSETVATGNLTPELAERWAVASGPTWLDVIVDYESWTAKDLDALRTAGAVVVYELYSIPTVFAYVRAHDLLEVAGLPGVRLVENNERIEYDMDTAVIAGNVTPLWGTKEITINGTVIDGKGVTVAVVDTGVNAAHDDIKHKGKTVRNMMALGVPAEPPTTAGDPMDGSVLRWEDVENSDGGGHGSHVAGIVAGDGTISGGKIKGAAPGASLVGLGSQLGSFWYAVAAWDWVFQNHKTVQPNIRVITNSWGYALGTGCNPEISLTKVQKKLVLEANVVMLFSAGNGGGDGSVDRARTQFKCPWEGNIGVGNYFDENTGTRDAKQSNSSSRGSKNDPTTWPDVSGPGTQILATRGEPPASTQSYLVNCQVMRTAQQGTTGCYTTKSGTSMSTPFVAGVVALLLQARPDLKPADVEYILEQTAYKYDGSFEDTPTPYFADPALDYRNHGSHYFKGHGLVDAAAAVQFAMTYDGTKTPVVYGEKETPSALPAVGKVKKVGSASSKESTPGLGLAALVALLAIVVLTRSRRD